MSINEATLDMADIKMLQYHNPEAVIHIAFRRVASDQERQMFGRYLATNGGDVLSAIIDTATSADSERIKD